MEAASKGKGILPAEADIISLGTTSTLGHPKPGEIERFPKFTLLQPDIGRTSDINYHSDSVLASAEEKAK